MASAQDADADADAKTTLLRQLQRFAAKQEGQQWTEIAADLDALSRRQLAHTVTTPPSTGEANLIGESSNGYQRLDPADVISRLLGALDFLALVSPDAEISQHYLDTLASPLEALGIAARDPATHALLRSSGVVETVIQILVCSIDGDGSGLEPEELTGAEIGPFENIADATAIVQRAWTQLIFEAWRLIANLCADDDTTRESFIQSGKLGLLVAAWRGTFAMATSQILMIEVDQRQRCIDTPSQALYNLVGYEPAVRALLASDVVLYNLTSIVLYWNDCATLNPEIETALPIMMWDLLDELVPSNSSYSWPARLPIAVMKAVIHEGHADGKEDLIKACAAYLMDNKYSAPVASHFAHIWILLCLYYNLQGEDWITIPTNDPPILSVLQPLKLPSTPSDVKTRVLSAIADVLEIPETLEALRDLSDEQLNDLVDDLRWPSADEIIITDSNEEIIECLCMVLGNFARSDETSQRLLSQTNLSTRLLDVLGHAQQYSTRTMATRLVKNLGIPVTNRDLLGRGGTLFRLLARGLKESVRSELLHATIASGRTLISPRNALMMLSKGSSSDLPTFSASFAGGIDDETTFIGQVIAVVSLVDDQGIQVEAGRLLKRLLQCTYGEGSVDLQEAFESFISDNSSRQRRLLAPLSATITHQGNAIVRSEGWLALVLLAKTAPGADVARQVMSQPQVFDALRTTLGIGSNSITRSGGADELQQLQQEQQQQEEERTVLATTQQQAHDKANVQLLLRSLIASASAFTSASESPTSAQTIQTQPEEQPQNQDHHREDRAQAQVQFPSSSSSSSSAAAPPSTITVDGATVDLAALLATSLA